MRAEGANGVSAGTRTDCDAEDSAGNSQETPNQPRHRIAARLRLGINMKGLVWAAARDGWRSASAHEIQRRMSCQ